MTDDRTITVTPGDDQPGQHHTDPTGTIAHTGPAAGCTLPGCAPEPDTDPQAARWARREPLLVLLSRMQRGVLLPQERDLLRAAVQTELADGDQAREQLAAAQAGDAPWIKAYGEDIAAARQGEAEAVRAREAAEDRATLAETARDVVMARLPRLYAQLTKALRLPPSVQWDDIATAAADCYDRAERAEATLTAVRALLPDDPRDDKWTDHVTATAVRAALGDPQPATEPTPAVCCVCGCPEVTYRNCNEQPFCCRCAMCCDPPKLCTHGCQQPTCPAQNTATPDRVAHCDLPAHHDDDHRDSTVPGVLRWTDDVAVYPATAERDQPAEPRCSGCGHTVGEGCGCPPAEPEQPAPALPLATCDRYGTLIAHATHLFMRGCRAYRCPGLTVTDRRAPATGSTTIFTLPGAAVHVTPQQVADAVRRVLREDHVQLRDLLR